MKSLTEQFPILSYFTIEHLPPHLQSASAPFRERAYALAREAFALPEDSPARPEAGAGLRSLLIAKDAAVRVAVASHEHDQG